MIFVIAVPLYLEVEDLLQLFHGIIRSFDRVANCPGVGIDLIIVTANKALVTKEVDGLVLDARHILLRFNVLQTVRLVPASREDIEGNLSANGVPVV